MARRKSNKKPDFKKIVLDALIGAGTGAAAQIACDAIKTEKGEYKDYGLIAAGIILPEFIKHPDMETAGTALLAVGAYRLADRNDLGGKMGLKAENNVYNVGNVPGRYTIGSGWQPREVYAESPGEKKSSQIVQ